MSIITDIWNKGVTEFKDAEAWIALNVQKAEAAVQGTPLQGVVQQEESALKQMASDALGALAATEATYEPVLAAGAEKLADSALLAATGGKALPLIPFTNSGIDKIVKIAGDAFAAWALAQKAALAENNAAQGGGAAPAQPSPQ